MNISATYQPSAEEIKNVVRNRARGMLLQTWIASGVTLVIAIVAAVLGIWVLTILALLICGFSLLILRAATKSYARVGEHLGVKTTVKLTDDGFSYTLPGDGGTYGWSAARVQDAPTYWTFTVANRAVVVVPKEALRPTERTAFEKFLAVQPRNLVRKIRR